MLEDLKWLCLILLVYRVPKHVHELRISEVFQYNNFDLFALIK
jgi:hypothetical protein